MHRCSRCHFLRGGLITMKVYLLNRADVRVFCDGKLLPIRREAGTEYIQTDKADGETVVLRLVRKHELSRPLWALYALLFWIVGIMGFFTPRYSKFPHSLDCSVSFTENKPCSAFVSRIFSTRREHATPLPSPSSKEAHSLKIFSILPITLRAKDAGSTRHAHGSHGSYSSRQLSPQPYI